MTRSNKNQISKDLQEIASALPDMISHTDSTAWLGSDLLLTELDFDPKTIDKNKIYNVTYLHWRPHNHLRSLKQIVRKAKGDQAKKKAVLQYIAKYKSIDHGKA
jgi:hypothetical protein